MDGLDLLVTNTGGPPSGKFEDHSEEVWQNATNLVFLSHVRLIQAATAPALDYPQEGYGQPAHCPHLAQRGLE